jgi:PST family polysaccharide transporter
MIGLMEDAAVAPAASDAPALGRRGRTAVLQLLARTVVMRGLSLVGTIVLARILAPADFGMYAVVVAVVTIVTHLSDVGLAADLVRQRSEPARHELATAWTAQQILMGTGVVAIWVLAPLLLVVAPDVRPDAVWLLRVGSLALFLTGLRVLPQLLLIRALRFGPLAAADITMQVAFYGVAIAAALAGAGAWSFVLAFLVQGATSTLVINLAWRSWPGIAVDRPTLRRLVRFGLPLQLSAVINWGSENAIPLAGSLAGGLTGIGHLQFASRLAVLAASIDDIVAKVTFPVMSRLQDDPARRGRAAGRVLEVTTMAIVGLEGLLVAVAPVLVPIVFSDKWTQAVQPLQLMALAACATVPARMLRSLLWASGRTDMTLRLAILIAALAVVLAPVLVILLGLPGGGLAALIGGATSLFLHRRAAFRLVAGTWWRVVTIYGSGAVAVAGGSVALVAAGGGLAGVAAAAAAFGALYGAGLLLTSRAQVRDAWAIVRGSSTAAA